jgi:hypothetical protein
MVTKSRRKFAAAFKAKVALELIAGRRAHRVLIVSPAGPLLNQWDQELRTASASASARL